MQVCIFAGSDLLKLLSFTLTSENYIISLVTYPLKYWFSRNVLCNFSHSDIIVNTPGKSLGQRSLVGYSPWCHCESGTTQQIHFHFSLSCIGEGNGNPLQCSFLENPRDWGTWWTTVYGVAQSRS